MAQRLDGTVALVTGASSGIGEATAVVLAAQGIGRPRGPAQDRLDALAATIRDGGGTALVLEADVTQRAAGGRHGRARGDRARPAGHAGQQRRCDAARPGGQSAPLSEWQRRVELNVLGLLYGAHAALPHLLQAAQTSPRLVADMVNISSVAGRVARNGSGVYNATKHGVGAFSEALRQEVTRRHVRVSLVEPGAVETELAGHNRPEIQDGMRARFAGMERMEPRTSPTRHVHRETAPARGGQPDAHPPDEQDLWQLDRPASPNPAR
jgi:NADP-dependent 3-hydroxy acid dehydrogenase YdfG